MNKMKNYFFKFIISLVTLSMLCTNISPSLVMALQDASVHEQENSEVTGVNNENQVNESKKQVDVESRESLLFEDKKEDVVETLKEEGYKEEIKERTETSKIFVKGDMKQTVIYNDPIHYNHNGKLNEYNNTLTKSLTRSLSSSYLNKAGDHNYVLPDNLKDGEIKVDNLSITMNHVSFIQGEVKDNAIIYKNAQENKDYSIEAHNNGLKIKTAVSSKEEQLTQSYTLKLLENNKAVLTDDKTALYIYENDKPTYVISPHILKDADGNVIDLYDLELSLKNNQLMINPTDEKIKQLTTAPYSMEVSIKTITNPDHSLIKLYGIRSGDQFKNISYAPEVNSAYAHFAQVGRDPTGSINVGVPSPENIGLCKVDFQRLVDDYIGENRRIEDAKISFRLATTIKNTSTLSISRFNEKMPLFDNYNNLKWTKYESYFNKYKDRNQDDSPVRLDTKTVTRKPGTVQFIDFNITDALDYWYQGNPAYGLLLEGDSAIQRHRQSLIMLQVMLLKFYLI